MGGGGGGGGARQAEGLAPAGRMGDTFSGRDRTALGSPLLRTHCPAPSVAASPCTRADFLTLTECTRTGCPGLQPLEVLA